MLIFVLAPAGRENVACRGPCGMVSGREGGWLAIPGWIIGWALLA